LDRWKRQIPDEELLNLSPEELCKDRQSEEYFRLTTEGDCRDVVRYDFQGSMLSTPVSANFGKKWRFSYKLTVQSLLKLAVF
jgi:hypothetical protein